MTGAGDASAGDPTSSAPAHVAAPSQQVVLVRHGETEWSRTGRHTGRSDIPLDPEGEDQARRLGPRLREWSFAEVLVSPLRRAWSTCDAAGLAATARPDPDLQEWWYGEYEGRTVEEIRAQRPGWTIWRDGVVGGESVDDVGRRADSVISRVRAVRGDVCLVAHGHLLRILAARWCGLPVLAGAHLALSAASVSVLGYERDDPAIWLWDDTHHLAG